MKFKKIYKWGKITTAKEALLWSIAKWHLLYKEGYIISDNSDSCACCVLYVNVVNYKEIRANCLGCPISKYMEHPRCEGTPYYEACDALRSTKARKPLVKKERDFLIKVYNKYYDRFIISEFEQGPYRLMKKYLKVRFQIR